MLSTNKSLDQLKNSCMDLQVQVATYMLASPTQASVFLRSVHHPWIGWSHRIGGRSEGGMGERVILADVLEGGKVNIPHLTATNIVKTSCEGKNN